MVLLALAAGAARAGEQGAELVCAPSAGGFVTTWLFAGPIGFSGKAELDRDFLKDAGGEAAVRPRDGDVADAARKISWRTRVLPGATLSLTKRCLASGESAFYLAAVLVPRKDADATVVVAHTGWARLWVDGKKVASSDHDPASRTVPRVEHKLSLRAGKRVRCLLKMGSSSRRLQFLVALRGERRDLTAEDVGVVLPRRAAGPLDVSPYVLSSLSLGLGRGGYVLGGRKTDVVLSVGGGYPECTGKVSAKIAISDSEGRPVGTLSIEGEGLSTLAAAPARVAWTPPKANATPYYKLTARIRYAGKEIGTLSRTAYSPGSLVQVTLALHRRLAALKKAGTVSPDELAHPALKIEKAILLQRGATAQTYMPGDIHGELETASRWLGRLEKGRGLPPLGPGVHELAYHAEQDDSAQPYYLHIPRSYTGKEPLPAIVYLHGYAPDLDKTNWHMPPYALTDQAAARGYLIVVPFARSNTDFQAIGEVDVLHALELARRRVRIDPDRIYLAGYSMGGMGAYTIAAHYPHLWAGVVALCARSDYYLWKDLDPAKVEPFKRHVLDLEFGWPHAGNFLHVPVLAFQGTADFIKPEQAYRFIAHLKRLGTEARCVRLPGLSHWIGEESFSTPTAFDWMARHRRVAAPKRIRYTTHSLRYPRAYWLTVDAFIRQGRPATAEITLEPGNRLKITTDNVAQLTLAPPAGLCKPKEPFAATINGKAASLRPSAKGQVVVTLAERPKTPLRKTPALCGPIKDALHRRFLLVPGTTGDKKANQHNLLLATRFRSDWYRFAKGSASIVRDTGLPAAEIARSNLVLFGTPKSNAILAKIADKLPVKFTPKGYQILGHTYKATEATGLMFIYPNPLAPDRYVVVYSGTLYGGRLGPDGKGIDLLPENHKFDLLPDFIVYSDEADYDDSNAYYCAGFFDSAWQLDPKLTWTSNGRRKAKPSVPLFPQPALPPSLEERPAPAVP